MSTKKPSRKEFKPDSRRLNSWDYATPGYYFVTICTKEREPIFGNVLDGVFIPTKVGEVADAYWREIPVHHANVTLDHHIVMPNHIHGIVVLNETAVETLHATSLQPSSRDEGSEAMEEISPKKGSLGSIVRSYKGAVTRWSRQNGHPDFAWQPRYYDHVIRDDESLDAIRRYIRANPLRWQEDRFYPHD